MNREHELRHLQEGPEVDERPSDGIGLVRFDVQCREGAEAVLAKAKEVLAVVVAQPPAGWPTLDERRQKLPEWFLNACVPEYTNKESDRWLKWWRSLPWDEQVRASEEKRWSLGNWLYWFEPKQRFWYWWDGRVESPQYIRVALQVTEWPFPWDALKWLFRASGAESVAAEK